MLFVAALVLIASPFGTVLFAAARQLEAINVGLLFPRWSLLLSSAAWASGIALLTTILGWVPAWAMRGGRGWLAPLMMLPLMLPCSLSYHALGMLRAPTTWLGDVIARAPEHGWPDLPLFVGRALALIGLALWSWPLATLVLAPAVGGVEESVLEALRLDRARGWTGLVQRVRMLRGDLLRAWALVFVVMLGSAVPLHLAQVPTLSVAAWQEVVLKPGSLDAWIVSWPMLFGAGLGAWLIARRAGRWGGERPDPVRDARRGGNAGLLCAFAVLGCATLLPLMLYALSLREWSSLATFVNLSGDGLRASTATALLVGALCGTLCLASWRAWSMGAVAIARTGLVMLLMGVLAPGVLVGHAWATLWAIFPAPDELRDGLAGPALAHMTRFAGVAALAGIALATLEPSALRDARRLDAGDSLRGWVHLRLAAAWWAPVGVGLAMACLSLHEVEATIVLQPPGLASLAQTMLSNLHFARLEETSAGALVMGGMGLIPALLASWLMLRPSERRHEV
jgi:ABC-type Fe3+ transport system permease subunit